MSEYFKNVLLIGATGDFGRYIFSALLELQATHPDQPINISVLTRPESKSTQNLPSHVTVHRGDTKDRAFLSEAFRGQDIILSAISPYALAAQKLMLDVAAEVGVKRFLLGEFGLDTDDKEWRDRIRVLQANHEVLEHAKAIVAKQDGKAGGLQWTGIITGAFIEMCVIDGELGFDFETRTARIYDEGLQKMEVSKMAEAGKAVTGLIFQPDKFVNELLYISSWTVGQADILAALNKVDPKGPWKVERRPAKALQGEADRKMAKGDMMGLVDEIWAVVFEHNWGGQTFSKTRKLSNKELGIVETGKANFEETMASIVQEWENGRRQ